MRFQRSFLQSKASKVMQSAGLVSLAQLTETRALKPSRRRCHAVHHLAPGLVSRYTLPIEIMGKILLWSSHSAGAAFICSFTPTESALGLLLGSGELSISNSSSSSVPDSSKSAEAYVDD